MKLTTRILRGLLAGARATMAMSTAMRGAQAVGLIGKLPPRKITDRALEAVGIGGAPRPARAVAAPANHLAFGRACGALYASLGRARRFAPEPIPGILFGTLVWAVSYAGWVPAARILPPPQDDDPERVATMVGAHLVYGAVLGRACAKI
ncbi:MAG: DUF6789 family protein [Polyangiaceae bacterium]